MPKFHVENHRKSYIVNQIHISIHVVGMIDYLQSIDSAVSYNFGSCARRGDVFPSVWF